MSQERYTTDTEEDVHKPNGVVVEKNSDSYTDEVNNTMQYYFPRKSIKYTMFRLCTPPNITFVQDIYTDVIQWVENSQSIIISQIQHNKDKSNQEDWDQRQQPLLSFTTNGNNDQTQLLIHIANTTKKTMMKMEKEKTSNYVCICGLQKRYMQQITIVVEMNNQDVIRNVNYTFALKTYKPRFCLLCQVIKGYISRLEINKDTSYDLLCASIVNNTLLNF